jgi:hypothetical protein
LDHGKEGDLVRTWTVIPDDTIKRLHLQMVDFKGGSSSSTKRSIPNQTAQEAALQGSATNYANTAMGTANSLLGTANTVAGNAGNVYSNYNNTANDINSGYASLLSGNLPSSYATARQQALNSDLTGTVGSAINSLGSRGILNSSVTGSALDQISQNAADTLAKNYASDQSTYSGLLGNASANNTSNLNNFLTMLSGLSSTSDSLANNTSDLFNQMYSGRMGTGSTTTTQSDGGSNAWNAVGSLGSAALLCFVAGTMIACPDGNKPIERIQVGDKVYSLHGIESVIHVQEPQISPNDYMVINTDSSEVRPTSTQPFLTTEGDFLPAELIGKELVGLKRGEVVRSVEINPIKELIYDFKTTGENIYFANGFAVRGCR